MTLSVLSRFGLPAVLLLLPHAGRRQNAPPQPIFKNPRNYTANDKSPRAEAVAVKGDKIVFVGKNDAADKLAGPATKVIDLKGATLLPGLTDAHMHLSGVGAREMTLNLEGTNTLDAFLAKVKARLDRDLLEASGVSYASGSRPHRAEQSGLPDPRRRACLGDQQRRPPARQHHPKHRGSRRRGHQQGCRG